MVSTRCYLVTCAVLALAGCQPVAPQTFPIRQPETATETPGRASLIQASDDPQMVIDKMIQAYGGPEKCGWKTGRVKFKALFMGLDCVVEDWFELPGKFKRIWWKADGVNQSPTMTFITNRRQGWVIGPNGSVTSLPEGDEPRVAEHYIGAMWNPTHLRDEGCKATILGEEIVHDRKAVVLKIEAPNQARRLFLDESTSLVLRIHARLPKSLSKEEADADTDFEDYRDFQGANVPTRITGRSEGKVIMDITILELEFFDKIDDSVFAKP